MREGRGERMERESKKKEREKKVKAPHRFRPCGLVPPGIAEHSVKILHFKINHSRLGTKRKTHMYTFTHANKGTFTQPVTGIVFCPCLSSTKQPQHVTAVYDSRPL